MFVPSSVRTVRRIVPRGARAWSVTLGAAALGVAACSGAIDGGLDPNGAPGEAPVGSAPGRPGGGVTSGGGPGTPGGKGTSAPSASPGAGAAPGAPTFGAPAGDPSAAGPFPLRRLTNREYENTVRDLLGDTTGPGKQFASDRDETFLFRRAGAVAVQDVKLLRAAAEALAASAVTRLATILPCDPVAAGEQACLGQFLEGFAPRAFRRPLAASETERLRALYTTGRMTLKLGFGDAIGLLIEGILQAPAFLYHWQMPAGPPAREGALVRLSHYEVASRLSYFLWGTMPDKELFAAAAMGRLGTEAEIEAQGKRLLADARAKETVAAFFTDWLALDELADKPKSTKAYPEYDQTLAGAMVSETRAFTQHVIFEGDGRFATLLEAGYSFVNQGLAGVYGIPGLKGTSMQRVDLNPVQRAGLLTQPAFLALTGSADGSNPARRGAAVVTKLLCREIPVPPANVPPPKPPTAGGTTRARFAEHAMNDCARACHGLIDPIGFGFEAYDGIGKFRTTDNGQAVDASGSILLDGMNKPFNGGIELGRAIAASAEARACFARQWMRFGFVRDTSDADQASLAGATTRFSRPEAGVKELLLAVATSRSFRYRAPALGEVLP